LYEGPGIVKFIDRKKNGDGQGWGSGEGWGLMSIVQFGKMRKVWRWMVVMAA
jgi:hypothetical protein